MAKANAQKGGSQDGRGLRGWSKHVAKKKVGGPLGRDVAFLALLFVTRRTQVLLISNDSPTLISNDSPTLELSATVALGDEVRELGAFIQPRSKSSFTAVRCRGRW